LANPPFPRKRFLAYRRTTVLLTLLLRYSMISLSVVSSEAYFYILSISQNYNFDSFSPRNNPPPFAPKHKQLTLQGFFITRCINMDAD
jgi:hypothetical protein